MSNTPNDFEFQSILRDDDAENELLKHRIYATIPNYVPRHQNLDWNIYDGNLKVCRLNLISILAPSDSLFEQEYMYNTCKLHQIHVVGNVHVISSSWMNEKTINLMNKLLLSLQETAPITLTTTLPILKPRNIVKLNLSIHFSWTWSVFHRSLNFLDFMIRRPLPVRDHVVSITDNESMCDGARPKKLVLPQILHRSSSLL